MVKRKSKRVTDGKVAAVRIQRMALDDLVTPDFNNRTITDAALQGLGQSLTDFGLLALPIVNVKGGRNIVVGGNQRVRVLRESGEESVPCVVVEMDESDERLANFTLNNQKIQGDFVPHLVREVMERIRENAGEEYDKLAKRLRFDVLYKAAMRNLAASTVAVSGEPRSGRVGDDDTPSLGRTEAESRSGRHYRLGDHVLYCGKLSAPGNLKGFGVERADMSFARFVQEERFKAAYLDTYLGHTLANTDGPVYLATTLHNLPRVQGQFQSLDGHWSTTIMAHSSKRSGRKGELYRDVVLPVLYGWRSDAKHFFYGGRDKSNLLLLTCAAPKGDVPVEVAVFAMQNSSRPGDVVLDAHVAQGATVVAAEKTGRKLVGYVQSPREMDRVRHRWTRFMHGDKADWRVKTGEVA